MCLFGTYMYTRNALNFAFRRQILTVDPHLVTQIVPLSIYLCRHINNGVYRAGLSTKQEPYDVAVREVFAGLDRVEAILARQRYLTGDQLTEADVRLFTTLVRFDKVYVGVFKVSNKF